MKKTMIFIGVIAVCCITAIYLLILRENNDEKKNAFERQIKNLKIKTIASFELSDATFRFSTKPDYKIKLNQYSDRLNLYELDYSFKTLDTIKIKFSPEFYSKAFNVYKDILLTNIFCTNPYGDIQVSNNEKGQNYKFKGFRFDWFQALSPNSIIVRGRYPSHKQNNRSLAKLSLKDSIMVEKEYLFPDIPDGLFANDGMLLYDRENATIIYMYYYIGEIITLDTNLNLISKFKTIDTVRMADIKTKIILKDTKRTLIQSTPPKIVNSFITTNNGKIYIRSKLKSDNEPSSMFNDNQVIDVYDIKEGKYVSSFYLPKFLGKKVTQFQMKNNLILALYGKHIVKYGIDE